MKKFLFSLIILSCFFLKLNGQAALTAFPIAVGDSTLLAFYTTSGSAGNSHLDFVADMAGNNVSIDPGDYDFDPAGTTGYTSTGYWFTGAQIFGIPVCYNDTASYTMFILVSSLANNFRIMYYSGTDGQSVDGILAAGINYGFCGSNTGAGGLAKVSANNGLSVEGDTMVQLGGDLIKNTLIRLEDHSLTFRELGQSSFSLNGNQVQLSQGNFDDGNTVMTMSFSNPSRYLLRNFFPGSNNYFEFGMSNREENNAIGSSWHYFEDGLGRTTTIDLFRNRLFGRSDTIRWVSPTAQYEGLTTLPGDNVYQLGGFHMNSRPSSNEFFTFLALRDATAPATSLLGITDDNQITRFGLDSLADQLNFVNADSLVNYSRAIEVGQRVYLGNGSEYMVSADSVENYTVDSIAVIPIAGGKYAQLQPKDNGYFITDFGANGIDTIDDTVPIRKAANYMRYHSKSSIVFVPKGTFLVNENLSSYNPKIEIYGNLVGENRDSSIIKADSVITFNVNGSHIFRFMGGNNRLANLAFEIIGNPTNNNINQMQVVQFEINSKKSVVDNCHFRKMTVNTGGTAGNVYVSQFTNGEEKIGNIFPIDTVLPGQDVSFEVSDISSFYHNCPLVLSDTTYSVVSDYNFAAKTITVANVFDTLFPETELQIPTFGTSEILVQNSIFENNHYGGGLGLASTFVTVTNNIFRNNGNTANRHDMYMQSGYQIITNNWFQGGLGAGYLEGNKQVRVSGGTVIQGNVFFNKERGIILEPAFNHPRWFLPAEPLGWMGNRVLGEGYNVSNNVFHATPGNELLFSLIINDPNAGIQPESVMIGNGSLLFSNNTITGNAGYFSSALRDEDWFDVKFSENFIENNDSTTNSTVISYRFNKGSQIQDNVWIARGDNAFLWEGEDCIVRNNTFKLSQVRDGSTPPRYLSFINPDFQNNYIELDTMLGSWNRRSDFIDITGGEFKDNVVICNEQNYYRALGNYENQELPNFIDNKFINASISLSDIDNNDKIRNKIIKDNEGMVILGRANEGYSRAAQPQAIGMGQVQTYYSNTLNTSSTGGFLINFDHTDSTYVFSTASDYPTGTLLTNARGLNDETIVIAPAEKGRIIRAFTTNASSITDYLVIDGSDIGKVESVGNAYPDSLFVLQALEDVTVWDNSTAYEVGDIVTNGSYTFKCVTDNTNVAPVYTDNQSGDPWHTYAIKARVISENPNAIQITNPVGGENSLQASLDSLKSFIDNAYYTETITLSAGSSSSPVFLPAALAGTTLYQCQCSINRTTIPSPTSDQMTVYVDNRTSTQFEVFVFGAPGAGESTTIECTLFKK